MCAAPLGNRFWEQRASSGRNPIFKDHNELWGSACEYFIWCEDHPLQENKIVVETGVASHQYVDKLRAMTISGLCLFLDISQETFRDYSKRDGFIGVSRKIKEVIYTQKFEGASAGMLNANIIARDLGLSESVKNEHTGKDGGPMQITAIELIAGGDESSS
jgi:hypothetical protein